MRLVLMLGILSLASGCVLHTRGPYRHIPSPHPAPQPRAMSYGEAVSLGQQHCRSRGYRCELKEAHRTGNEVWKVKFRAFTREARGHLHLDFDAYTRNLLKVNDKVKARKKHRDDDWDDGRGHGRGRGKKKGHSHRDD
ncbi:MAG TPA: hypothetical protein VLQ93_08435 [Myxococcaceae bacterium]|nr:hypothetical protein [Myxococcaceae bacterium]